MRYSVYILVSVLCFSGLSGRAQSYFSKRYDTFGSCDGTNGIDTMYHGYISAEITCSSTSFYTFLLGLYNSDGTLRKNKVYLRPWMNMLPNSGKYIRANNNTFWVSGTRTYKPDTTLSFLWRFNSNLDSISYHEYGYLNKTNVVTAFVGSGKYIYMAGYTDSIQKNSDILLIKTDTLGNEIWKKKIGLSAWDETAYSISVCSNGDLLVSGLKKIHGGSTQGPFVMRLDSSGSILWENFYPSATYANGSFDVKEIANGDIVFTGGKAFNINANGTLRKPTLTRLTPTGALIWQKEYGQKEVGHDFFTFLINDDNEFVVSGEIFRSDNTSSGMVYVINQNGDSILSKEYRILPNSQNYFRDVVQAPDKGYCFSGFVSPMNGDGGTQDIWLLKVDSNFCESNASCVLSVASSGMEQPGIRVYPNPAKYQLHVTAPYEAQSKGNIILSDALGHVLENIPVNGQEEHQLNIESYAPGIYFLSIQSPAYSRTYKILKDD